jgi:Yip1-like protein
MTPEQLSATEPEPQGMSAFSRVTGVFFEPAKTFEDIAARPGWLLPMALIILSALAFSFSVGQRVGFDRIVDQQVASRMANLSPEQREQAQRGVEVQKRFAPVGWYAGSVIAPPIVAVVCSGVLLGIVAGILSTPMKFKQVLSIYCWSAMPGLISTVLTIVVMYLKSPDDFNIRNPLAFNPAAFLDPTSTSKFLYSIASWIDVFVIWRVLLLGIGLKAAGGKRLSMGSAMAAVLLPFAAIVLISAGFASMFG